MKIPTCPHCGDSKIILAPIKPDWNHFEQRCGDLPVHCVDCQWRGTWKEVIYRT